MTGVGAILAGAAGIPGRINQSTLEDAAGSSGVTGAQIQFQDNGGYRYGDTLGMTQGTPWVIPANTAVAALYQVQVDVLAGSVPSGTTGSWLDLSTSRAFATTDTPQVNTVRVRIREKGTGVVRCDQNVSMNVT